MVSKTDSATLADKIRSIVENRELRNQMAISAREQERLISAFDAI